MVEHRQSILLIDPPIAVVGTSVVAHHDPASADHGVVQAAISAAPRFQPHDASSDRMFVVWQLNMLMLPMHNAARAKAGLAPLQTNWNLAGAALAWSEKEAAAGKMAHFGSDLPRPYTDTSTPWTRIPSAGFPLKSAADGSENVAWGSAGITLQNLFDAWMSSAGHKANILGAHWNYVGFGSGVAADKSTYLTADYGYLAPLIAPRPEARRCRLARPSPMPRSPSGGS